MHANIVSTCPLYARGADGALADLCCCSADKMLPAEERGVRGAIAFSELLQHPNLVRMMGTWESHDIIFVGKHKVWAAHANWS